MLITKNIVQERKRKALNQFHFSSTPLDSSTKNCFHYKNNRDSQSGVPFLLSPQNSHAPFSSSGLLHPATKKLRQPRPCPQAPCTLHSDYDFLSGQCRFLYMQVFFQFFALLTPMYAEGRHVIFSSYISTANLGIIAATFGVSLEN